MTTRARAALVCAVIGLCLAVLWLLALLVAGFSVPLWVAAAAMVALGVGLVLAIFP